MYWGPNVQIYKLWGMFLIQKQEPTVEGQELIQVCDRSWEASCRLRGLQLVSLCIQTVLLGEIQQGTLSMGPVGQSHGCPFLGFPTVVVSGCGFVPCHGIFCSRKKSPERPSGPESLQRSQGCKKSPRPWLAIHGSSGKI